MTAELLITIVCGVISSLIATGLFSVVKWRLKELGGWSGVTGRLSVWFYARLRQILIAGILLDVFLLAWVLIKFPTVKLWTVLVIILSVALMAFQMALYLIIKIIDSLFSAMLKLGKPKEPPYKAPETSVEPTTQLPSAT